MVKGKYGLTHIVLSNNFRQSFSKAEIVESNFYFFLKHHLKTLNKEEYNLTHVIKNTHGLAYVAFSIFLADCDQGTIQFDAFCQWKKSIKFSFRLITFYYFKDFNHGQYGLTHIVLSKKKDQTAFKLCCTSLFTRDYAF